MRTTRRRGFTLVETVLAIVILAMAVPPMLWAVKEAHHQRMNPMLASKARWLATSKLEDIIADRHSPDRGYAYLDVTNYAAENKGDIAGYIQFSRSVSFVTTDADLVTLNPAGGYRTATVAVGWTDGDGTNQTLSISTVLTDYAPN